MRRTLIIAAAAFCLGGFANQAFADRQPKMRDGLVHLEKALNSLQAATHDKGGHRVKAIQLTKDAIEEVKKGIAFDNKN
jgi:hypothetical protein